MKKGKLKKNCLALISALFVFSFAFLAVSCDSQGTVYTFDNISIKATLDGEEAPEAENQETMVAAKTILSNYFQNKSMKITSSKIKMFSNDGSQEASYKYTEKDGRLEIDQSDVEALRRGCCM